MTKPRRYRGKYPSRVAQVGSVSGLRGVRVTLNDGRMFDVSPVSGAPAMPRPGDELATLQADVTGLKVTPYQPLPRLPWLVIVNPDWYDEDEGDAGYAWSGEAANREEAINKALDECWADNDREDEDGQPETAPTYRPGEHMQDGFTVYQAEPDFHTLAVDISNARQSADRLALGRALDVLDYALSVRESF